MRPKLPNDPEVPDLEPIAPRAALPALPAAIDEELEAALDRAPSLPPEPASWITDWAEYSGSDAPRSASSPPPRTSGFVRVHSPRQESARSLPIHTAAPSIAVRSAVTLGRALAPGLSLIAGSALLTLIDARTLPSSDVVSEFRPPTWVAGVLCIGGLCLLVRGLWRYADSHDG